MSHSLPMSAQVVNTAFGFIQSLFRRPAPAPVRAESDVWTLYKLSRGRDTVSPAVMRKLEEAAAK